MIKINHTYHQLIYLDRQQIQAVLLKRDFKNLNALINKCL
jgi:hypothetical protein